MSCNIVNESCNLINRVNYGVQFQTTSTKGVVFYVADKHDVDFVGIYINKGRVSAAFNCGGGVARATSAKTYDDGQWHNVSEIKSNGCSANSLCGILSLWELFACPRSVDTCCQNLNPQD